MNPDTGKNWQFETDRLEMRSMQLSDSLFVVKLKSSYDVYRYFGNPHPISLEEHSRWFRQVYTHDASRVEFVMRTKEDHREIGVIGLSDIGASGSAKVDYSLVKEQRGRGYAFEALTGLCEFFKREFDGRQINAVIHLKNATSLALANKCGFRPACQDGDFVTVSKNLLD